MKIDKNSFFKGVMVEQGVTLEFAEDKVGIEFNGKTYLPTDTLAYFTFIMCHTMPSINSHHFSVTPKTMVASYASALNQLLNIRHILASNDAKGRLSEDRIVGHIVDVCFPVEEWQEKGQLTADLMPSAEMTEGVPLLALGCLQKRAKGIPRIIAEHQENDGMWANSVEMFFPWSSAAFLVDGKMIAAVDAPDDLFEGVKKAWAESKLPDYRHNGCPVYLIGGGEDGEVMIAGSALTTYPADSKADIIAMAASFDGNEEGTPRAELPDSCFVYVEATGDTKDGITQPDKARHGHLFTSDGALIPANLEITLAEYPNAKPVTESISAIELQGKLTRVLLPLAEEHFPDSGFVKAFRSTQEKGGENNMDLVELLKAVRASLDDLAGTDGFKAYKEAGGKVTAARSDLFAVLDKAEDMVRDLAEARAKVLSTEALKDGYIPKADHETALAEAKAELDKAIEAAKATWDTEQAEKDAKTLVTAERMDKLRDEKVTDVPAALKAAIDEMPDDDEGKKAFDAVITSLASRRKACTDAGIDLSEEIETRIVTSLLGEDDEAFKGTLALWQSLAKGTVKASKKPDVFVPAQASDDSGDKMLGVV